MKKTFSVLLFTVFLFLTPFFSAVHAEESVESRLAELQAERREAQTLRYNTLSAPLVSTPAVSVPRAADPTGIDIPSLLDIDYTVGYEGALSYRQLSEDERGIVRIRYSQLKEPAAFFFTFAETLDARNRWFRLRTTGLRLPERLALEFDHDEMRNDSRFYVYPENSAAPSSLFFKLPDKFPYSQIDSLRFIVDPETAGDLDGDFLILGLELLPPGADPLAKLPPSDLTRFEWYTDPFEADNEAPLNTQYRF